MWDFEGRVPEANDEFLRMVGYDREDLLAGSIWWTDLTPPDWRDRNNARIEQQKSGGRFEPFEKEFTRKDGSRVPILIGGATFEEGGNQGVAFVLDLTERKRVEDALREREVQLAEARRELRQMIIPSQSRWRAIRQTPGATSSTPPGNNTRASPTRLRSARNGPSWRIPTTSRGAIKCGVTPLLPASPGIPRSASGVPTDSIAGSASIVWLRVTRTARSSNGTAPPMTSRIASAPRMRCGRVNTSSVRSSKPYQATSGRRTPTSNRPGSISAFWTISVCDLRVL